MPKVTNEMRIQDINAALVAHEKQSKGEKLNRREKQAVNNFADLYVDIAEEEITPALRNTLRSVLMTMHYGDARERSSYKNISQVCGSADALRTQRFAIKKFAAKVSENEDNAISATLAELTLNNGVSDSAIKDIKSYLDTERSKWTSAQRNRAMVGAGIAATAAVVGGALAGPLILWIPAVTVVPAAVTETAAAAVSLLVPCSVEPPPEELPPVK